ncbi:unnamed protein product [Pleuronectes platessa]|uniref:Uncharacterized protein n=1 Tax=Pleuronectes platessa TaxID=8262 RepID=A0A9N7UKT7_PLEPL|nr:unnamed protein product [Pleuronectes platessa]
MGWILKVALGHCCRRLDASVRLPASLAAVHTRMKEIAHVEHSNTCSQSNNTHSDGNIWLCSLELSPYSPARMEGSPLSLLCQEAVYASSWRLLQPPTPRPPPRWLWVTSLQTLPHKAAGTHCCLKEMTSSWRNSWLAQYTRRSDVAEDNDHARGIDGEEEQAGAIAAKSKPFQR